MTISDGQFDRRMCGTNGNTHAGMQESRTDDVERFKVRVASGTDITEPRVLTKSDKQTFGINML